MVELLSVVRMFVHNLWYFIRVYFATNVEKRVHWSKPERRMWRKKKRTEQNQIESTMETERDKRAVTADAGTKLHHWYLSSSPAFPQYVHIYLCFSLLFYYCYEYYQFDWLHLPRTRNCRKKHKTLVKYWMVDLGFANAIIIQRPHTDTNRTTYFHWPQFQSYKYRLSKKWRKSWVEFSIAINLLAFMRRFIIVSRTFMK